MPTLKSISVKKLQLDLSNYRTVKQKNEVKAIHAMISVSPDRFWALTESLLTDGYHPTENIIVLKQGGKLVVKEGNRRVAILKVIAGLVKHAQFDFPDDLKTRITTGLKGKKSLKQDVPCAVYESSESATVDKIVALTHGKGEKAGRDKWTSVARARHNRDYKGAKEPALDLLEKYLKESKSLSESQRERWGGDYPLTVLDEALNKLFVRAGQTTANDLADNYPNVKFKRSLDIIMMDIGSLTLDFKTIRNEAEDFAKKYGFPAEAQPGDPGVPSDPGAPTDPTDPSDPPGGGQPEDGPGSGKPDALPTTDPKAVIRALKKFRPKGDHREKLVTLLKEARLLNVKKHPHSFCFVLRSMFEISAKAYCADYQTSGGPKPTKDGKDKFLVDLLKDVHAHMLSIAPDKQHKAELERSLHSSMVVLSEPRNFLSVTSLNQFIHSQDFVVTDAQICSLFFNVLPFLKMMNR